jgi:hypothetical protein
MFNGAIVGGITAVGGKHFTVNRNIGRHTSL